MPLPRMVVNPLSWMSSNGSNSNGTKPNTGGSIFPPASYGVLSGSSYSSANNAHEGANNGYHPNNGYDRSSANRTTSMINN
jgi:hypothetical protein